MWIILEMEWFYKGNELRLKTYTLNVYAYFDVKDLKPFDLILGPIEYALASDQFYEKENKMKKALHKYLYLDTGYNIFFKPSINLVFVNLIISTLS